jgi:glycosyltransferase involved in cell wall biosynthesis
MTNPDPLPLVSICCITYNHAAYIAQAMDSFLMQKTNFKYELIIGEDNSCDGTQAVLKKYASAYPDAITVVNHNPNIGAIANQIDTFARARGKYIACCDGDDFWTDPFKLQKQVDFLEANPAYVICCHHTTVINENGEKVYEKELPREMEFGYMDVLLGKREETRNCSLMVRNDHYIHAVGKLDWYSKTYGTDSLFKLYILSVTQQKIYVMPDIMACYRLHKGGIWSMIPGKIRKGRMISDFNIVVNNFNYPSDAKRSLLKIYLQQYLLFDLRNLKINNVFNTLTSLF